MSDSTDLNEIVDDFNGISASIFSIRHDLNKIAENSDKPEAHAEVKSRVSEVIMLIDDVIAIMVEELGAEFEDD